MNIPLPRLIYYVLTTMLSVLVPRPAVAQLPIPAGADVVAAENGTGGSRIVLLSKGEVKTIFTDTMALVYPILSPDGQKIAFDRGVPLEHAGADIVVIDRWGKVLSSTFIDKYPLRKKKLYNTSMSQLSGLAWMSDGRLAITAQPTSRKGLGVIFAPTKNISLDDGPDLLESSSDVMFDNDDMMDISPSGKHVATFNSLVPQTDDGACAGLGRKKPDGPKLQSETLEIDGADLQDLGKPIEPWTGISWYNDQKLSMIVLDPNGFEVLTVSNIPIALRWDKNDNLSNPPMYSFTKIPISPELASKIMLDGYVDQAESYTILAYEHEKSSQPVQAWTLANGRITWADASRVPRNPADGAMIRQMSREISAAAAPMLAKVGIHQAGSVDVSCRAGAECGALAADPYENGIRNAAMMKAPLICAPESSR